MKTTKIKTATEDGKTVVPASAGEKKKPAPVAQAAAGTDAAVKASAPAKRGRKPKVGLEGAVVDELDMSDIKEDLVGEPVVEVTETTET
ncbi:MAG TPA: RNA polymerase sigma factor RpoD, partial [Rhodoferax sp.]|nr:RNA polymerase sigma factor RpoD [Rhodoferax sp.]